MDQITNKAITISGITQGIKNWIIVDQDKKKYTLWLIKKDGEETMAYKQFKRMELVAGKVVDISFKEDPASFVNDAGKTVNFTNRTVIGFRETNDIPLALDSPKFIANQPKEIKVQEYTESREDYGRRLAIHGMVNGMLSSGQTIDSVMSQVTNLIDLEDHINEVLAGKVDDGEIRVEDIPF